MSDINKTIKELWQKTYRNQDIDYIQVRLASAQPVCVGVCVGVCVHLPVCVRACVCTHVHAYVRACMSCMSSKFHVDV